MRRFRTLLGAALALMALIAVVVVAEAPGEPAKAGTPDKAAQSRALTEATTVQTSPFANTGEKLDPAQARSLAASLMDTVPLPDGGNFNGIQFEAAGGQFTVAEVEAVAQFNAACQWLRARSDGREPEVAGGILADVPRWSAIREAGFPASDPRQLESCDQSAARESEYAQAMRLTPSR